ncbi:MAG: YfiR family protein [Aeromonas sp.]
MILSWGFSTAVMATDTLAPARSQAVKQLVLDILSYTRWPTEPVELRICVVAAPEYAKDLASIDRQANGRAVRVNHFNVGDPAITSQCDVMYLGAVDEPTRFALFSSLKGRQILSISENNAVCSSSAVFCLQPVTGSPKMRFKVNLDALSLSGVKVHPAVLKLARAGQQDAS